MPTATSKRLYLRGEAPRKRIPWLAPVSGMCTGLPTDATKEQLEKSLSSYGSITEVKILPYYAFVEFESTEDATRVLETYSKIDLLGTRVIIEYAHPMRRNTPSISNTSPKSNTTRPSPVSRPSRIARHPVVVLDLPRDIGWKELKDFGRSSGALVSFCDLDKMQTNRGFIEFFSREDAKRAVQVLDGQRLGGQRVRVVDHQDWRAHYGPYEHKIDHGRSRSPRRPTQNRNTRAICAPERTMSTSPEDSSSVGYSKIYPGTHIYDASMWGRTWYPRRRRSQEDEYDSYEHYLRAATFARDYALDYNQESLRSRERLDFQVDQEASYSCRRRTWFAAAAAADTPQKFHQHRFDYYRHQGIQDADPSDGHGFGEQHKEQWPASNSDYHWPGHGSEAGYDSTIADAEYPSRLDEAQCIQQRLTLHSYQ